MLRILQNTLEREETVQSCWILKYVILDYFHGATAPGLLGPPYYRGFTISLRHTTLIRIPLDE